MRRRARRDVVSFVAPSSTGVRDDGDDDNDHSNDCDGYDIYARARVCARCVLVGNTSTLILLGQASVESFFELLAVQVSTDEHHAVHSGLALGPRARGGAEIDLFVHALEDKLGVALAFKAQYAL